MLTEEKIKEIQKLLRKGVPEGELKNQLTEQGYTNEDIEEIFISRTYDVRGWLLVAAILILFFGLYLFITNSGRYLVAIAFSGFLFYEYYKLQQKAQKSD
ncbi:MAG: hypothetical protein ABJB86_04390 [Bacteroidota bacterium]